MKPNQKSNLGTNTHGCHLTFWGNTESSPTLHEELMCSCVKGRCFLHSTLLYKDSLSHVCRIHVGWEMEHWYNYGPFLTREESKDSKDLPNRKSKAYNSSHTVPLRTKFRYGASGWQKAAISIFNTRINMCIITSATWSLWEWQGPSNRPHQLQTAMRQRSSALSPVRGHGHVRRGMSSWLGFHDPQNRL